MRNLGRLLLYVRVHRARVCLALALAVLGVVAELARPWPVKVVVDHVLSGTAEPPWLAAARATLPGAQSAEGLLLWCVASAVAIAAAAGVLAFLVLNLTVGVAQRLVFDLSMDVFDRLQRRSIAFHGRHTVGDLQQRVTSDVFVVHLAVTQVAIPALVSALSLAGMFVIMASLDATLALIAASVVPLLAGSLGAFARPMQRTTRDQYASQGALMALVEQSLSAIKAIQGFARESYVQSKLGKRARELGDAYGAATRVSSGYKEVTSLITGVAAAALLGLGAKRVLAGRLSVGDLWIFLGYLAALYGPVNALSVAAGAAVAVSARARRVFEILDEAEEVPEREAPVPIGRARGEIVFEDVTFGYGEGDGRRAVLEGVSFTALPGQVTAIVGATGAGKSSLVSLISRFYDPWHGRVLLDGHDVKDLGLRSLRENVSLVLQDPFLFPMSVADNIAFGRPGASRAEIVEAAKAAHAHEFVSRLPEGYETVIGEKGATLSGGERQRVAIARALLKDAPVLILDEPTSALDAHTESKIFEALSALMRDRTTFIISHRLSTIRRADLILALEDGRIAERGTHETLVAGGSVYSSLYRRQHIAAL